MLGLPQATAWPLGFPKHPMRFPIFWGLLQNTQCFAFKFSVNGLRVPFVERTEQSVSLDFVLETETLLKPNVLLLLYQAHLRGQGPAKVFLSHLLASIYLTFSLLLSVPTSRQRLESEICLITWFFVPLSLSGKEAWNCLSCVWSYHLQRGICAPECLVGEYRDREVLRPLVGVSTPAPNLKELNSYMSFWEVKTD